MIIAILISIVVAIIGGGAVWWMVNETIERFYNDKD